eukprot:TRINITY_DN30338_c0_g1_i1.p1 TRINITY_DN30338_c0_g1~~TRINITY_DN30338_c0_g1_i1.p1  ORF type:complete len:295 (-),score=44.24 TRINITY_DN30338_c0_g1_i1:134-1018(-)
MVDVQAASEDCAAPLTSGSDAGTTSPEVALSLTFQYMVTGGPIHISNQVMASTRVMELRKIVAKASALPQHQVCLFKDGTLLSWRDTLGSLSDGDVLQVAVGLSRNVTVALLEQLADKIGAVAGVPRTEDEVEAALASVASSAGVENLDSLGNDTGLWLEAWLLTGFVFSGKSGFIYDITEFQVNEGGLIVLSEECPSAIVEYVILDVAGGLAQLTGESPEENRGAVWKLGILESVDDGDGSLESWLSARLCQTPVRICSSLTEFFTNAAATGSMEATHDMVQQARASDLDYVF